MLRRVWRPLPPSRVPRGLLGLLGLRGLLVLLGVMVLLARMAPMVLRAPLVLLDRSVQAVPMVLAALPAPPAPLALPSNT